MMTSYESSQMSLREQAQVRAQQMQSASLVSSADDDSFDDTVYTSFPPYPTPSSRRYASTPVVERNSSIVTPQQQVAAARQEWQRHGWTKSQALEDLRSKSSVWVRVTDAVERRDPSGSAYTAYLIQVRQRQQPHQQHLIEHRYSDFYKLHLLLSQNGVKVAFSFPAKLWWKSEQDKIAERLIELDAWIVHVVAEYWNAMNAIAYHAVQDFLFSPPSRPCDSVQDVQSAAFHPFSRTLGSSLRQAVHTLELLTSATDQSIPLDLLQSAQGILFLTILKAGLVVSGQYGTGLVISRLENGYQWSAPCAVGLAGLGWGAQLGSDVTHCLVLFSTAQAVHDLVSSQTVQLGAAAGVAVGTAGRTAQSSVQLQLKLHRAHAYAHAHGLFVGVSLEGSWITVRDAVNAKFYGQPCHGGDLLHQAGPPAAESLYRALDRASQIQIAPDAFRPSEMLNNRNRATPASSWKNAPA
jgi:lipid-binding SYLF domain-containing protein